MTDIAVQPTGPAAPAVESDTSNVDIDTPADFIAAHPSFPTLIGNPEIRSRWRVEEDKANPAKQHYTRFGQFALGAAFITFTAVIYAVTLEPWLAADFAVAPLTENVLLKLFLGALGLAGVGAQIFLLRGPLKEKWMDARFHAERLRSIKFQAFQAAACGGDAAAEAFTKRALADLAADLGDVAAARENFEPAHGLVPHTGGPCTVTPAQLSELKNAYQKLRINRQSAYARRQISKIKDESKLPTTSSEYSFWAGVGVAYVDAILAAFSVEATWLRPVLHFVTLELFIISALLFVLERGRNYNMALERYTDYRDQMIKVGERLANAETPEDFIACVAETERQALRELKTFCREAEKSTYLI